MGTCGKVGGTVRLLIKLLAMVVLAMAAQVTLEVSRAIITYPYVPDHERNFTDPVDARVTAAAAEFRHYNRVSQWILADVIDMPLRVYAEPPREPLPHPEPPELIITALHHPAN